MTRARLLSFAIGAALTLTAGLAAAQAPPPPPAYGPPITLDQAKKPGLGDVAQERDELLALGQVRQPAQRLDHERGVAQPAVAVVPRPRGADRLGDAGGAPTRRVQGMGSALSSDVVTRPARSSGAPRCGTPR